MKFFVGSFITGIDICLIRILTHFRGTHRLFSVNSCSGKQKLPRSFYYLRTSENFWMTVPRPFHSSTIFKRENPYDFLKFIKFLHFTPQVKLFFVERRKPKISGFKNAMKRGIRKCLTFVPQWREIVSKNFRENDTRVPLGWPNRYKSVYSAT